ncbi:MAG: carbohydrate-binding domain-containing protein [Oscillospiraceae bacterium]|jgi:hypothetical protein|nr:carbohydrate-binding domain-containing protein [Oscillospiraceae bacterium]
MKKIISVTICVLLLAFFAAGCGIPEASPSPTVSAPPTGGPPGAPPAGGFPNGGGFPFEEETEKDSTSSESENPAQTITKDGTYTITGDVNGQILVTAKTVTLILDGANIKCDDGSAIIGYYDGGKQKLTVELRGTNTVSGAAHGIQGKDELTVTGSGTVSISAAKDGLHGGDKLTVAGGNINIVSSYEGIEAPEIIISGGNTVIHASDDGINAATDDKTVTPSITITGGELTVYSNSDGIDSNGTLSVAGGTVAIFINAPRDGDTTDVERGGSVARAMLYATASVAAGTKISVGDWSIVTESAATSLCLILPGVESGQTYRITADGALLAETAATVTIQGMMTGGAPGTGTEPGRGGGGGGKRP